MEDGEIEGERKLAAKCFAKTCSLPRKQTLQPSIHHISGDGTVRLRKQTCRYGLGSFGMIVIIEHNKYTPILELVVTGSSTVMLVAFNFFLLLLFESL